MRHRCSSKLVAAMEMTRRPPRLPRRLDQAPRTPARRRPLAKHTGSLYLRRHYRSFWRSECFSSIPRGVANSTIAGLVPFWRRGCRSAAAPKPAKVGGVRTVLGFRAPSRRPNWSGVVVERCSTTEPNLPGIRAFHDAPTGTLLAGDAVGLVDDALETHKVI